MSQLRFARGPPSGGRPCKNFWKSENRYGGCPVGHGDGTGASEESLPTDAADVAVGGKAAQLAAGLDRTRALLDGVRMRCRGRGKEGPLGYDTTA